LGCWIAENFESQTENISDVDMLIVFEEDEEEESVYIW
jgi:hypothetical protein